MDATVTLLGASGYTGRLVAAALDRRGVPFVAAGRAADRVRAAVEGCGAVTAVETADVTDPPSLARLAERSDVLATTVGPFAELGRPVLEAAVRAGCDYLDTSGEQAFVAWAFDGHREAARAAGVTAVPGCGFEFVTGDLLAAVTAPLVAAPTEVHVAYLVRGPLGMASRGTRATLATIAGRGGTALVDGRRVTERFGDHRRVAWFPRPVGPRHAVGFPGGEPLTVPHHLPTVRTVRSYAAVPAALAEVAVLAANVLRLEPARQAARRLLPRGGDGPSPPRREATRWACVAELVGRDGEVARGWAHGRDLYGFTAEAMAAAAERLVHGRARATGVLAPAEAFEAEDLLDDLADRTGMRWTTRAPAV